MLGRLCLWSQPPKPWGRRGVWGAWFLHDRSTVSLNICQKLPRGPGLAGAGGRLAKPQPPFPWLCGRVLHAPPPRFPWDVLAPGHVFCCWPALLAST